MSRVLKCILTILILVQCWKLERKILFSKFLQIDKRLRLSVISPTSKNPRRRYGYIVEGLSFKVAGIVMLGIVLCSL